MVVVLITLLVYVGSPKGVLEGSVEYKAETDCQNKLPSIQVTKSNPTCKPSGLQHSDSFILNYHTGNGVSLILSSLL